MNSFLKQFLFLQQSSQLIALAAESDNKGGGENDFAATKTDLIKPLGLSEEEVGDLVAFLESLSGEEITMTTPKLGVAAIVWVD